MFTKIKNKVKHIYYQLKLANSLTDDQFLNTLILLRHQIVKIKNELYDIPDIEFWNEKLQDINLVLDLLDLQIQDDYFTNLELNIDKYNNTFITIKDKDLQLTECRTDEEILEDEAKFNAISIQREEDYKLIFTIISKGFYAPEGMNSWGNY